MPVVHYKGPKAKCSVMYPIGCKSRGMTKAILHFEPNLELSESDAQKLVALDPDNFEIAEPAVTPKPSKKSKEEA